MKFHDLAIGATFDFIGPNRALNSFYERCKKVSSRCYVWYYRGRKIKERVGTINAEVFNVVPCCASCGTGHGETIEARPNDAVLCTDCYGSPTE